MVRHCLHKSITGPRPERLFHEATHELRNLISRGIEREVACIDDVDSAFGTSRR